MEPYTLSVVCENLSRGLRGVTIWRYDEPAGSTHIRGKSLMHRACMIGTRPGEMLLDSSMEAQDATRR